MKKYREKEGSPLAEGRELKYRQRQKPVAAERVAPRGGA